MSKYSESNIGNTDYTKDKRPLGFLGDVFAGVFNGIGSFWKKLTGLGTTNSERAAMDYNAQQAQINRDFQSAEAQKARQWQEDFYTQYQSPQAQVRQYQDAGLNPALMYGRGATPAASASTASNGPAGDTASIGLPSVDSASLLSMMFGLAKLPSEIDLLNSQADDFRASAEGKEIHNTYSQPLLEQELQKGYLTIANSQAALITSQFQWQLMDSQAQLNYVNSQLSSAEIDNVIADTDKKKLEQVTEFLRQQNIISDTELKGETKRLVAAQIVTESMKPAMLAAQTFMYNQQGTSFSLDNFQKSIDNDLSSHTGVTKINSWPQLIYNVAALGQKMYDNFKSRRDSLKAVVGSPKPLKNWPFKGD